ncbi:MAG: transglycosylase SLT domain-containing protein [Xanthomonadales bacterium]|nr:transglycosylase SLT domain-containing protein [Xanthomonadales bacterium]
MNDPGLFDRPARCPRRARALRSITETRRQRRRGAAALSCARLLAPLLLASGLAGAAAAVADDAASAPLSAQREAFSQAWQSAARGDRAGFETAQSGLQDYLLYPYLRYEDLRHRRARADPDEMATFLAAHADWAFSGALRAAWLRALAAQERWELLLDHAGEPSDTALRCQVATARIETGDTATLLPDAQALWAVGRSQPDECDPVFRWLQAQGGITAGLAWQRVGLAMEERQPRLTLYLARFLPVDERAWVDRWYQQDRSGYRQLEQARRWPGGERRRQIVDYGLRRLARSDPDRAWTLYQALQDELDFDANERNGILREIALWSAVEGAAATGERMRAVPESARDDRLLEWWVRFDLAQADWPGVARSIEAMTETARDDGRWRYWYARALQEVGDGDRAEALLAELALEASYHGFLAADWLGLPYTVCAESPSVMENELSPLAGAAGIGRALELRRAGVKNWARSEWLGAVRRLDREGLRAAAALAVREDWPEMAIFALGDSGDRQWYEWRFPLDHVPLVDATAASLQLDTAWVMGLMRSESAMAADALSPAGAYGLMQVLPGTARQLSRAHGIPYSGHEQLLQPADNVRFGTAYLRDLLDRYGDNPVLATGAYNAGPGAVDRWLADRPASDPAIWVETLPYFETRDYIPRVLAFTTLYDWRLQRPVARISSRMPAFDSSAFDSTAGGGTMQAVATAEVVCRSAG